MAASSLISSHVCGLLALVVIAFLALPSAFAAEGEEGICHASGKKPFTPFGLDLCYMFSHRACCLSGYDQQYIRSAYTDILPLGAGCEGGSTHAYTSLYALRQFLCLPCDPNEPSYRFRSIDGDMAEGGLVPPSPSSSPSEYTWRICRSFLYGKETAREGLWGDDGSRYDQCGVVLQSCPATPLFDIKTAQFSYPPSQCASGTELVVPSILFKASSDPGLEMLLRVAQTMHDFQMVIVDDSDPSYDYKKLPCFGHRDSATVLSQMVRPLWLTFTASLAVVLLF